MEEKDTGQLESVHCYRLRGEGNPDGGRPGKLRESVRRGLILSETDEDSLDEERLDELYDLDPLYLLARDYLSKYEIGLAPDKEELTHLQVEAICFVNSETHRQIREKKDGDEGEYETERTYSDAELARLVK